MKKPIRRFLILIGLAFVCTAYPFVIQPQFKFLQAYWIIKAILELTFWVIAFYPNYSWSKWSFAKRTIAIGAVLLFCLYFAPVEFIFLPIVQKFYWTISMIMTAAVLLDDNNDNDDDGGKREGKVDKKKLKWVPEGT